jgi:TRAP transporter solute receptor, TAXI family
MAARALGALLWFFVFLAFTATSAMAGQPNWPASLTLVTASPGGTYHVYGAEVAKLLTRALDLPVAERTTEGPSENIRLIEAGEAQIGFVTLGAALQAWNGEGDWTHGRTYRGFRAAFPMYDTPFQFVVPQASSIQSVGELEGMRIGVGPDGGTAGTYLPRFLATLGINATLVHGTWDELAAEMENGNLDALAAAGGAPFPVIAALEKKKAVRFVPLSDDQVVALRLAIPELTASQITPGTYPSLMAPYRTVGLYNFAVVRADLPADLVFDIVAAVFAGHDQLVSAHPAAAATVPQNFTYNTFLPYHEGASRYYSQRMIAGGIRGD